MDAGAGDTGRARSYYRDRTWGLRMAGALGGKRAALRDAWDMRGSLPETGAARVIRAARRLQRLETEGKVPRREHSFLPLSARIAMTSWVERRYAAPRDPARGKDRGQALARFSSGLAAPGRRCLGPTPRDTRSVKPPHSPIGIVDGNCTPHKVLLARRRVDFDSPRGVRRFSARNIRGGGGRLMRSLSALPARSRVQYRTPGRCFARDRPGQVAPCTPARLVAAADEIFRAVMASTTKLHASMRSDSSGRSHSWGTLPFAPKRCARWPAELVATHATRFV